MSRLATLSNELQAPRVEWQSTSDALPAGVPAVNTNLSRVSSGTASIRVQNPSGWTGTTARFAMLADGQDHFAATYLWIDGAPNVATSFLGFGASYIANLCRVVLTPTRTLRLEIDTGTSLETVQAATPTVLATGTKYLIEFRFRRHATTPNAGADHVELRIDGVTEVLATNVNSSSAPTRISVGANLNSEACTSCDLYLDTSRLNTSVGTTNNSWCGHENVHLLLPDGAGEFDQSTTLTGTTTAWQAVLDNPPTELANSTYVTLTSNTTSWTGTGSRFAVAMSNPPTGLGTINFVSVVTRVRNSSTSSSAHAISLQIANGGPRNADWESGGWADNDSLGATWVTNRGITTGSTDGPLFVTDPNGSPWTESALNNLQVLVRGYDTSPNINIGALYVLVSTEATPTPPTGIESAPTLGFPRSTQPQRIKYRRPLITWGPLSSEGVTPFTSTATPASTTWTVNTSFAEITPEETTRPVLGFRQYRAPRHLRYRRPFRTWKLGTYPFITDAGNIASSATWTVNTQTSTAGVISASALPTATMWVSVPQVSVMEATATGVAYWLALSLTNHGVEEEPAPEPVPGGIGVLTGGGKFTGFGTTILGGTGLLTGNGMLVGIGYTPPTSPDPPYDPPVVPNWVVIINGQDRTSSIQVAKGVNIKRTVNERSTASFTVMAGQRRQDTWEEYYVPSMKDEVYLYDQDGVLVMFGGLVYNRTRTATETVSWVKIECVGWEFHLGSKVTGGYVGPLVDIASSSPGGYTAITTKTPHGLSTGDTVGIKGHNTTPAMPEYSLGVTKINDTVFTVPFATSVGGGDSGTVQRTYVTNLRQVLRDLVNVFLYQYGITLDPTQPEGPSGSHPGLNWVDARARDVISTLTTLSNGYLMTLSPLKVLSMRLPGTVQAPHAIIDADTKTLDMSWRESLDGHATRITLHCGPEGVSDVTESWVIDAAILAAGYVRAGVNYAADTAFSATINGLAVSLAPYGSGTPAHLEYLLWNGKVHLTNGSLYTPVEGHTVKLMYRGQFPFTVVYPDPWPAGPAPIDEVLSAKEATDYPTGVAMAKAEWLRRSTIPREIEFTSRHRGWDPGQTVYIFRSDFVIDASAYITGVEASIDKDGIWAYHCRATIGAYQGSKLDFIRALSSGSRTPVTSVSGMPVETGGGSSGSGETWAMPTYMGGSRNVVLSPLANVWVPIFNHNQFSPIVSGTYRASIELYGVNTGSIPTVTARVEAWDGSTVYGISASISDVVPNTVIFDFALQANNPVRLAVRSNNGGDFYAASATIRPLV